MSTDFLCERLSENGGGWGSIANGQEMDGSKRQNIKTDGIRTRRDMKEYEQTVQWQYMAVPRGTCPSHRATAG